MRRGGQTILRSLRLLRLLCLLRLKLLYPTRSLQYIHESIQYLLPVKTYTEVSGLGEAIRGVSDLIRGVPDFAGAPGNNRKKDGERERARENSGDIYSARQMHELRHGG